MATRRPDPETLEAIRAHRAARHEGEITDDEIALERKGRLTRSTRVTVIPARPTSPAWFICRACPEGGQRFRTDVGADPLHPPRRHIAAIRRHFRDTHDTSRLPASAIYHGGTEPALASYVPSTPLLGAQLICELCPAHENRIRLERPPYGDARSFPMLAARYPQIAASLPALTPAQRAARWEAEHRGITAEATQAGLERGLREARAADTAREPPEAERGLRALFLQRVAEGGTITKVIDVLVEQIHTDPDGYASTLARAIPGLEHHRELPDAQLAALARELYAPLERDKRTLWRIWRRIPDSHKDAARAERSSA